MNEDEEAAYDLTHPPVRVRVVDAAPLKTQLSSNRPGICRSFTFSADGPEQLVGQEYTRARLLLYNRLGGNDFTIGGTPDEATYSTGYNGFYLSPGNSLEITHCGPVWVSSQVDGGVLSVLTEYYATTMDENED